jgi:myosin heavy subunit
MEQYNNEPTIIETKRNYSGIYIAIIAALAALSGYLFFAKNKTEDKNLLLNNNVAELGTSMATLQTDYDAAKGKLDELYGQNASMDSLLKTQDSELAKLKADIENILKDKNATASQLKDAQSMIKKLNGTVSTYQAQIVELKKENIQLTEDKKNEIEKNTALTAEKQTLTTEKQNLSTEKTALESEKTNLTKKVELGSVLHASSIRLEAINQKKNLLGQAKEVETSKARKTDLMRMAFDLDDNRISESGDKVIYICLKSPNGNIIGNSTFKLADGSEIKYTTTKIVPYKQGEKSYGVSTDWKPETDFEAGNYKVELYNNGYKIGNETVTLK